MRSRVWFFRLPKDLAWDVFTLDCILAALLAMGVAAFATMSDSFAALMADEEEWIWITIATLGIVALVCLLRIAWQDEDEIPERRWK